MELDFGSVDIYGRQEEQHALKNAFLRTKSGTTQLVVVEGLAGSGKSSLVEKFLEEAVSEDVICLQSKVEEGGNDGAFQAIKCCLQKLLDRMMQHEEIRQQILNECLRADIQILATVAPAILQLVEENNDDDNATRSTQRDINHANSQYSLERLRRATRSLLRVACKRFLVLVFIDDLHWADEGALMFIKSFLTDKQGRNIMVIATMRPVDEDHHVGKWLADFGGADKVNRIAVSNLGKQEIQQILSRILRRDREDVALLADEILAKTRGNAFFVKQFIRCLRINKLIDYNLQTYRWEWDVQRIHAETSIADNVADLIAMQVHFLSGSLRTALMLAAFLGPSQFTTDVLLGVFGPSSEADEELGPNFAKDDRKVFSSKRSLSEVLDEAVMEGLVEKLLSEGEFKFSHDRIRESLASMTPSADTQRLHWIIGNELNRFAQGCPDEYKSLKDRCVLLAIYHLNRGYEFASQSHYRCDTVQLAKMNYDAAVLAFEESSFFPASEFLTFARKLLDPATRWQMHYNLTLNITRTLTYVDFCIGKPLEETQAIAEEIIENARSLEDKLPTYRTLIRIKLQAGMADVALDVGVDVLHAMCVKVPKRFNVFRGIFAYVDIRRRLLSYSDEELLNPEPCSADDDAIVAEVNELIVTLAEVSGFTDKQELATLLMLTGVKLSLKYGCPQNRASMLAICGLLYLATLQFNITRRFAGLSMQLANQFTYPVDDSRAMFMLCFLVWHWSHPYQECLELLLKSSKILEQEGAIEYQFHVTFAYCVTYYSCGLRLHPLESEISQLLDMLSDHRQPVHLQLAQPFAEFIFSLRGLTDEPTSLSCEAMELAESASGMFSCRRKNTKAMYNALMLRMALAYWFGDLKLASEMASKLKGANTDGPTPLLLFRLMFEGLLSFALAGSSSESHHSKKQHRCRGKILMRQFELFTRKGNMNAHHMMMLMNAEWASLTTKDEGKVQKAYDAAIVACAKLGFMHHQALGNELAGVYFLKRQDSGWASSYLSRARDLYARWGAEAKVGHLQEQYGDMLEQPQNGSSTANSVESSIYSQARLEIKNSSRLHSVLEMELWNSQSSIKRQDQGS